MRFQDANAQPSEQERRVILASVKALSPDDPYAAAIYAQAKGWTLPMCDPRSCAQRETWRFTNKYDNSTTHIFEVCAQCGLRAK